MGLWWKRRFFIGLTIAVCIGGVFCAAFWSNLLYGMQLRSSDFLFRVPNLYQSTQPEDRIVVVAIDDKSLDELGRFASWPRSYHAQLIDTLAQAKARVIVFDVLFSEPAPGDEELAASAEAAGNVIQPVLGVSAKHKPTRVDGAMEFETFLRPLRSIEESAVMLGHANVLPDEDGVVRRLPLIIRSGEDYEPALALAAVANYLRRPQVIESTIKDNSLPFAGRSIPLDRLNSMLINNTGTRFPTVSFADVLAGRIAPAIFNDGIVIVGATASGLGDKYWTPMGEMMSGVEIHASAVHTILTGNFLSPAPPAVTIAIMLTLALLCGIVVLRLRVLWATLLAILLCVVYLVTAFSFFDRGIMLNLVYPPLAILGTFVGVNLYNIACERSEKREITKAFGRYVPSPVVDKILAALGEGELKLGGQQREVTVAFADIRGFTGVSEKVQPEALVGVLNTYLSIVINAVLKHDGMINKFGGDSIMAVWNVPTDCKEHALLATMAAIDAQRAIRQLQQEELTLPRMDFGIGINTGMVVAGNMGSEDRLEYSVIGNAVNIASRLTSVTPGEKVWIGSDTYELVKDYIRVKPLKPLMVKGKRLPIKAYEVIDYMPETIEADLA